MLACSVQEFGRLSAELLRLGKQVRFQAHGSSMRPMVRDGDILSIEPVTAGQIRIGDIILCTIRPARVVIHRVVSHRKAECGKVYLVRGDKVAQPDGWVIDPDIHGRVVAVERDGTYFTMRGPAARFLSSLVVIRMRWFDSESGFTRLLTKFVKSLPVFKHYLA